MMIKVKEPYSHLAVAIEDNEYFHRARKIGGEILVDFIEKDGKKTPIVNDRELKRYEWRYEEGVYRITLKHFV